jgi:hypothetical protein
MGLGFVFMLRFKYRVATFVNFQSTHETACDIVESISGLTSPWTMVVRKYISTNSLSVSSLAALRNNSRIFPSRMRLLSSTYPSAQRDLNQEVSHLCPIRWFRKRECLDPEVVQRRMKITSLQFETSFVPRYRERCCRTSPAGP